MKLFKVVVFVLGLSLACVILGQTYQEAPVLAEKVAAGDLPPVNERLPVNPPVLEVVEEIGQYGGNWRRIANGEGLKWFELANAEPFLKWNRDTNGFRPNIASSWEYNEDATELTVSFVEGIKWSDGVPFTVDDYLFWWNDMVNNDLVKASGRSETSPGGQRMLVEKLDDYTLKFSFAAPNPVFLELHSLGLHTSSRYLKPAHYLKQFHPELCECVDLADSEKVNELLQDLNNRMNNPYQYPDMPSIWAWKSVEYNLGTSMKAERNPYYWKVDAEGNQLPYIDTVSTEILATGSGVNTNEIRLVKAIAGELDFQERQFDIRDIPLLLENQEAGDYRVIMWKQGNNASPMLMFQFAYKDEAYVDLMYNQDFRKALSHAINRDRVNEVVTLGLAVPRQYSSLPYDAEFQSEEGMQVHDAWANSYVAYDPELAKSLLDAAGVIDTNGDGVRELPNGDKLELVLDIREPDPSVVDPIELVLEDFAAIGINAIMNVTSTEVITERVNNNEVMIYVWPSGAFGGLFNGTPHWSAVGADAFAIGGKSIGEYYQTDGASGIAAREGSGIDEIAGLYKQAVSALSQEERISLVLDAYRVHAEKGPFAVGIVGDFPAPVIVKNNFRNVPDFGLVNGWWLTYPGTADPQQFFFKN